MSKHISNMFVCVFDRHVRVRVRGDGAPLPCSTDIRVPVRSARTKTCEWLLLRGNVHLWFSIDSIGLIASIDSIDCTLGAALGPLGLPQDPWGYPGILGTTPGTQ